MVKAIKYFLNVVSEKGLLLIALICFACFNISGQSYKIKTVVIDAGHGGQDPGAKGPGGTQEKLVALQVALLLGKKLETAFPDLKVIYTRRTDVFIPLHERASIANRNNADLFISIHCNSTTSRAPYGTETFVLGLHKSEDNLEVAKRENSVITLESNYEAMYDGFDPKAPETHILLALNQNAFLEQSTLFAQKVQNQYTYNLNRLNRGVKQAGFAVLYRTTMPSVLTELGFLSNPEEERYLASSKGQEELANALFNAFKEYKSTMETTGVVPIKAAPVVEENAQKTPPVVVEVKEEAPKKPEISTPQVTPPPANPTTITPPITVSSGVIYRIQIAVRTQPANIQKVPFSHFKNVIFEKQDNLYKYMIGNLKNYDDAQKLLYEAKSKGFTDAFIVVYQHGKRLPAAEAKKYLQ
jgi:N-acetylmuramoyl-L-alanine amidase